MKSKTPRSDKEACDGWSGDAICVSYEFSQRLERELNIAVKKAKKYKKALDLLKTNGIL